METRILNARMARGGIWIAVLGLVIAYFGFAPIRPILAQTDLQCGTQLNAEVFQPTPGQTFSEGTSGSIHIPVKILARWETNSSLSTLNIGVDGVELFTTNPTIYPSNVLLGTRWITDNLYANPKEIDFVTSSASYVNGENTIFARVMFFGNAGFHKVCETPVRGIRVNKAPPDNSALFVFIEPTSLTLSTGQSGELRAYPYRYENGTYTLLTSGVTFSWTASFGSIYSSLDRATFRSTAVGVATVRVTIDALGKQTYKEVVIYVNETSGLNSGSISGNTNNNLPIVVINCVRSAIGEVRYQAISSGQSQPTEAENEKFRRCFESGQVVIPERFVPSSSPLNSGVESCLKTTIGYQRFYEINTGKSRLTAEEQEKAIACFEKPRTLIPTSFAPIAPEKKLISALGKDDKVKVRSVKSIQKEVENDNSINRKALTITGLSLPNKPVYIYIFSDPIVLLTKADQSGEWSYTLENPLDPGGHEIYVAVGQTEETFVRSDPFFIEVAQAAPTDTNPLGGSLDLENGLRYQYQIFIVIALSIVGVGILVIVYLRRKMFGKKTVSKLTPNP